MNPKYPEVEVHLCGEDGNAYSILSRCNRAAREADVSQEERDTFMKEAMSGDYDHLLQTCIKWFTCL
jgi:hypothetical protein